MKNKKNHLRSLKSPVRSKNGEAKKQKADQKFLKLMMSGKVSTFDLNNILAIDEDHLGAKFELFMREEDESDLDYLATLLELVTQAKKEWVIENCPDWSNGVPTIPLEVLLQSIMKLTELGYLGLANELLDFMISKGIQEMPKDFVYLLYSVKNMVFDFDFIERQCSYQRHIGQMADFERLHYLIAALLKGETSLAEEIFEEIYSLYPETGILFQLGAWVTMPLDELEFSSYFPENFTMFDGIFYMAPFLLQRQHIIQQISQMATTEEMNRPDSYFHFNEFQSLKELKGISENRLKILFDNEIRSLEDFQEWSKDDLLALEGIGKSTLNVLEKNNVPLKD
ncbi:helix-hairpin-helix domain-containing protein [Streptococcus hongkongensis]